MTTSTHPLAGLSRPSAEPEDATHRGIYGNRVFDRSLHVCGVCRANVALAHSVRIRQDDGGRPRCFACRFDLQTGQAAAATGAPNVDACTQAEHPVPLPASAPQCDGATVMPRRTGLLYPVATRPAAGGRDRRSASSGRRPSQRLEPLGDLIFRRNPARFVDVTAMWCGDPPPERSALICRI